MLKECPVSLSIIIFCSFQFDFHFKPFLVPQKFHCFDFSSSARLMLFDIRHIYIVFKNTAVCRTEWSMFVFTLQLLSSVKHTQFKVKLT